MISARDTGRDEGVKTQEHKELLSLLKARFDKHVKRHKGIEWADVQRRLEAHPAKLRTLQEMESTGGEPDVVAQDPGTGAYTFCDCSPESPTGRRSVCYDREALDARKEHKPADSAVDHATTSAGFRPAIRLRNAASSFASCVLARVSRSGSGAT